METKVFASFCVLSALVATPFAAQQPPPVWKWDYTQIAATVNKVRAGRDLTPGVRR